jgi:hypothetical protein
LNWLLELLAGEAFPQPSVWHSQDISSIWEVVNGTAIEIGETRLVLIPSDEGDLEVLCVTGLCVGCGWWVVGVGGGWGGVFVGGLGPGGGGERPHYVEVSWGSGMSGAPGGRGRGGGGG